VQIYPADLDGDGNTDLVFYGMSSWPQSNFSEVVVAWGDGQGGFTESVYQLPLVSDLVANPPLDADGDGLLDLAMVRTSQDSISVLHNVGGRQFHW
jgi:hypothetical protein